MKNKSLLSRNKPDNSHYEGPVHLFLTVHLDLWRPIKDVCCSRTSIKLFVCTSIVLDYIDRQIQKPDSVGSAGVTIFDSVFETLCYFQLGCFRVPYTEFQLFRPLKHYYMFYFTIFLPGGYFHLKQISGCGSLDLLDLWQETSKVPSK